VATPSEPSIEGCVSPGFEPVRAAFVENFTRRGELGGACCIYQHGVKVVDLWGGLRDTASGEPWRQDTMVIVHSATKGPAAMAIALAHSRGWLDYDQPVCTYWPEFAQAGKERITVRQLLSHQAGLFGFDEPVDVKVVADLDRLASVMARQRPEWEPGERQAYHAITLGFYESELLRRVDPAHRSLGKLFADEIAAPLGLDFHIGLPASIPELRVAPLEPPSTWKRLTSMPLGLSWAAMHKRSVLYRSLIANPGTGFYIDAERKVVRELEVPSGGGVGSARALAHAYGVFASGGRELGLRPETLEATRVRSARPVRAARWATPTRRSASATGT
jgi:CubicO group peptidase (beta-lactamase class C family)